MRRGDAADAEERHRNRHVRVLRQRHDGGLRAGQDHPVARQNQRSLGRVDERHRIAIVSISGKGLVVRFRQVRLGRGPIDVAAVLLRVFGDVDQYGTGPAAARNRERFEDGRRHVLGARHQVIVLGDRQGNAGNVAFLKRIGSNQLAAHLSGDAHDRRRVHHRRRDAGDHVRGAGSRRRDRHTDAAARPRVPIGHMRGPLLVTDEDVPDRISEHRVVRGQDCTAWIAEHVGDAFPNQRFPEDLRTLEIHNVP